MQSGRPRCRSLRFGRYDEDDEDGATPLEEYCLKKIPAGQGRFLLGGDFFMALSEIVSVGLHIAD